MQIAEISSETTANESVEKIQKANKSITELFSYVNNEEPTIGAITVKYDFENIQLRGKLKTKDMER